MAILKVTVDDETILSAPFFALEIQAKYGDPDIIRLGNTGVIMMIGKPDAIMRQLRERLGE